MPADHTTTAAPHPAPKKRGPKPKPTGAGKEGRLELRVRLADRQSWQRAADAAGVSLAAWMQQACNRAAA